MDPAEIAKIFTSLEHLTASRYTNAAATTIYVYDIVITLDQEVGLNLLSILFALLSGPGSRSNSYGCGQRLLGLPFYIS